MLTIYGKWMYVYIMNNASSYGLQACTKKSFRQKKKREIFSSQSHTSQTIPQ